MARASSASNRISSCPVLLFACLICLWPVTARSQSDSLASFNNELEKAGALISLDGLKPLSDGARVAFSGGKTAVTDGPYAEAKEVVGGYWMLQFKSKQEAIESAQEFMELHCKHWPGWEGETEIRQIFTMPDYTCESGSLELKKHSVSGS